jgi:hypothetical protein
MCSVFNYSRDVYSASEPDICFHGHYPFANLAEGNYAEFIQADLVWGVNGPYNAFFRNTLIRVPTLMCFGNETGGMKIDHQNGFSQHFYVLGNTGMDHHTDDSFRTGERTSYYKDVRPGFITTTYTWPPLGCKFSGSTPSGTIPAKDRWYAGGTVTVHSLPFYSIPSSINFPNTMKGDSSNVLLPIVAASGSAVTINSITSTRTIFKAGILVPVTVNEHDTLKAKIVFKPTAFGSFTDTLTITSNGGIGKVILTGSSPTPVVSVSKPAIDYGSVVKNAAKKDTVKVVNSSINTLIVDSIYTKTGVFKADRV